MSASYPPSRGLAPLLLVASLLAPSAFAHGGTFRPPPPPSSPPERPEPPPPPGPGGPAPGRPSSGGESGGGETPGPRGPGTPAPTGPGTPSPNGPSSPGPTGPRTPTPPPTAGTPTTPGSSLGEATLHSWQLWWALSRDPWLDLAAYVRVDSADGDRTSPASGVGVRPSDEVVFGQVVPALVATLTGDEPFEVTAACLLALARIGEDRGRDARMSYLPLLTSHVRDKNEEVRESAIIAIGVLGDPSGMPLLDTLLFDQVEGRGAGVPMRSRALAGIALGLCAQRAEHEDSRRYAISSLARALDENMPDEIHAACVVGMGLAPLSRDAARYDAGMPHERRARAIAAADLARVVDRIEEILRDGKQPDLVRAQAPIALARLVAYAPTSRESGDTGSVHALRQRVLEALTEIAEPRQREARPVVRAAVIALGFVADAGEAEGDQAARALLAQIGTDARDDYAARRAWIALARVAGRPATRAGGAQPIEAGAPASNGSGDSAEAKVVRDTRKVLMRRFARERGEDQQWLALALAVLEHESTAAGQEPSTDVGPALRDALGKGRSITEIACFGTALGLAGDIDAEAALAERHTDTGNDEVRGALALSLGMVGARGRAALLREALAGATYRPVELSETAMALGLLRDAEAVPALAAGLAEARSLAAQASYARALGRIGDTRAVASLLDMLGDGARTDRARAFAAAALGAVADRDRLPWNTPLKLGVNPSALPATLFDAGGYGVLNLL